MSPFAQLTIAIIAAPYYMLYERGTRAPLIDIADAPYSNDTGDKIKLWFGTKSKEAQYVQVAVGFHDTFPLSQRRSC